MKFASLTKTIQFSILISAAFLSLRCSSDTFPKYVNLGGLRILGLRADLGAGLSGIAEFSPGDTVVVTPYISYFGLASAPTYTATGCRDLGVNYGAEPSCLGAPDALPLGTGTVSLSSGVSNTGAANTFSVTIPATILNGRSAADQFNGVNYLVTYELTAADGSTSVRGFKRLTVSQASKAGKNQNPVLNNLLLNGTPSATLPTSDVNLSVSYTAGSLENYSLMKSNGELLPQIEDLTTTYFITDGSLQYFRTVNGQTTKYTPPSSAPSSHTAAVIVVTRDPRGGVAVIVQALN